MRYLLVAALFIVGCQDKTKPTAAFVVPLAPTTPDNGSAQPGKKTYTRKEFKALVMGKTQDEVTKLLGKPDSTGETLGEPFWDYKNVTNDPASGKNDDSVRVFFVGGKVDKVLF